MPKQIDETKNYWVRLIDINEKTETVIFYMHDVNAFNALSETIEEYDEQSQTDEVEPETWELVENINDLSMTFTCNIRDSLKFVNNYKKSFSDAHHQEALDFLNECASTNYKKIEVPAEVKESLDDTTLPYSKRSIKEEHKEETQTDSSITSKAKEQGSRTNFPEVIKNKNTFSALDFLCFWRKQDDNNTQSQAHKSDLRPR